MEPNVPVRFPGVNSVRTEILSAWHDGKIATYEGPKVQEWAETVKALAEQLETPLELKVVEDTGFARCNSGFPIDIHRYTDEALEWATSQPMWKEQHALWTELFHSDSRGLC